MDKQYIGIKPPYLGLVTQRDASLLMPGEASDLSNVILDDNGILKRKGFASAFTVSNYTVYSDAFTRANNASLGVDWVETEANGTLEILSNEVKYTDTGAGVTRCTALYNTSLGVPDQEVSVKIRITSTSPNNVFAGVVVRATDVDNYYWAGFVQSNGNLGIYKRVAGTDTLLVQTDPNTVSITGSDTVKVVIINSMINVYLNGVRKLSYKDTAITTGNSVGFVAGYSVAATGDVCFFDDFQANASSGIRGITPYVDSSAVKYIILKEGVTGYTTNLYSASSIGTTLTRGKLAQFAPANNRMYIADGTSAPRSTDATALSAADVGNAITPGVAVSGTSGLTGEYSYKFTYYSSTWGIESPASVVSATVSPRNQQVDISGMTLSADTRIDKHRIYRRKISAGETVWRFVAEIAESTTYSDTRLDVDVNDETRIAPLSSTDTLPAFEMLAFYNERMWWAGGAEKTRLYYSEPNVPGTAGRFLHIGAEGEQEPITGLAAINGQLVILKKRSVFVLTGDDFLNFDVSRVTWDIGCVGPGSVVSAETYVYFAGEMGFYRFDGANVEELSFAIQPTWTARNNVADHLISGVHDLENGAIYWTYWSSNATNNDTVLCYFYRHSRKAGKHVWTKWTHAASDNITCLARVENPETGKYMIVAGLWTDSVTTKNAKFAVYGGIDGSSYSDSTGLSTSVVNASWTTGKIGFDQNDRRKEFVEFVASYVKQGDASNNLALSYALDDTVSFTTAGTLNMATTSVGRAAVTGQGNRIRLKLTTSSSASNHPMTLTEFGIEVKITGRA